jgi:L-lactate dehydrogenase (cytochrome)
MAAFSRLFFHARVLRPVTICNTSTTLLSTRCSLPIFICPAALARLGHPLGEANLTRGAHRTNIIQVVSSNASLSYAEIAAARPDPNQVLWFQLYKDKDDAKALERIREVVQLGYKAICLTVDAIVPGNREMDIKAPWALEDMEKAGGQEGDVVRESSVTEAEDQGINMMGTAGALISNIDRDMTWSKVSYVSIVGSGDSE